LSDLPLTAAGESMTYRLSSDGTTGHDVKTHSPELGRESTIKEHNRKVIMNSNTLLLTALGVMFCSGCTTEQPLERLGAMIRVNEQGEIVRVNLINTQISDAGVAKLKEALPNCDIHR